MPPRYFSEMSAGSFRTIFRPAFFHIFSYRARLLMFIRQTPAQLIEAIEFFRRAPIFREEDRMRLILFHIFRDRYATPTVYPRATERCGPSHSSPSNDPPPFHPTTRRFSNRHIPPQTSPRRTRQSSVHHSPRFQIANPKRRVRHICAHYLMCKVEMQRRVTATFSFVVPVPLFIPG